MRPPREIKGVSRKGRATAKSVALASVVLATVFWSAPAFAQEHVVRAPLSVQTISGDELRLSGLTRLSNLFIMLDGARFTTVDGFTTTPSFNGLSALGERTWRVEIDGHSVDDGVLDAHSLNTLGVPISAIDRIVVHDVPHVRNGRFESGGVIEIWTRTSENERFVRSTVSAGNETGDPGPFRYTDAARTYQNVDKEGPDVSIEGGLRYSGVDLQGGMTMNQIIPSDPAVFERNLDAFDESITPVVRAFAPFLALKSALPNGDVSVRVSGATFNDMLLSENIGREVPTEYRRAGLTAVANTREWGADWRWSSRLSKRVVRNQESASRIPFHWDEQAAGASVAARRSFGSVIWDAGFAIDYTGVQSDVGLAARQALYVARASVGVDRRVGRIATNTEGFVAAGGAARSAGIVLSAGTAIWQSQRIAARVSYAGALPSDISPMAYWVSRGLRLNERSTVTVPDRLPTPILSSADLQWTWAPRDGRSLQIAAIGRNFSRQLLPDRDIVADTTAIVVANLQYRQSWGSTIGVRARGDAQIGRTSVVVSYSYQSVMQGNQLFYDAFATVSRRQIRLSTVHRIASSFAIKSTVYHYSSTMWPDYREIEGQTSFSQRVPGFFRWDLTFFKTLADDRLQLTFGFENVLNDRVGYHPIGATFDRTLRVQLSLALD